MKNREHLIDGIAKKMKMKLISSPDLVLAVSRKGKNWDKKAGEKGGTGVEWRKQPYPFPPPFSFCPNFLPFLKTAKTRSGDEITVKLNLLDLT